MKSTMKNAVAISEADFDRLQTESGVTLKSGHRRVIREAVNTYYENKDWRWPGPVPIREMLTDVEKAARALSKALWRIERPEPSSEWAAAMLEREWAAAMLEREGERPSLLDLVDLRPRSALARAKAISGRKGPISQRDIGELSAQAEQARAKVISGKRGPKKDQLFPWLISFLAAVFRDAGGTRKRFSRFVRGILEHVPGSQMAEETLARRLKGIFQAGSHAPPAIIAITPRPTSRRRNYWLLCK